MPLRARVLASTAAALLPLLAGLGCAHRQPLPIPDTPQVRKVAVNGNDQIRRKPILDALGTQRTAWWARGVPLRRYWVALDRDLVEQDQQRLLRFYEDHGFFDARAPGVYTEYVGRKHKGHPDDAPQRWVDVTFSVEEGERSIVRDVTFAGHERLPPNLLSNLARRRGLAAGDAFELAAQEAEREAMERVLQHNGYAYAAVRRRAEAWPHDLAVDLSYTFAPGIPARFGAVTIVGLDRIPEKRVRREIRIDEGERYSISRLQRLQGDVFGMGVFSMVTVTPDLSDPTAEVVPVEVTVRESKPASFKLGVGVGLERGRDDAHVSFDFAHKNVFGQLIQLRSYNRFGWAVVPDALSPVSNGPIVEGNLELTEPTPLRALSLWQHAGFEVDLESGYKYLSPSVAIGLDVRLHRTLSAGLSYNYEFFWLYWTDATLFDPDNVEDVPEVDTDGTYNLSYLEQTLTWDARDDPLNTSRGAFARFAIAEAGGFLGGGFDYVKLAWEVRGYIDPVPRKLVLGIRAQAGWIIPWGDTESAPLTQRFTAGGSGSVRGWGRDQLGPRVEPETCDGGGSCFPEDLEPLDEDAEACARRGCRPIATGGHLYLVGGPEIRAYIIPLGKMQIGFAAFLDIGQVWQDETAFSLGDLMYSTGIGPRLRTSFGTFRFDVAFRLNRTDAEKAGTTGIYTDPMVLAHFGFSEAF